MRKFAVVILSNTPEKLTACLDALKRYEFAVSASRIVVVAGEAVLKDVIGFEHRCRLVPQSVDRFNFSREVNRGLAAAGADVDVFLLGDDARLTMPDTIAQLAAYAESNEGRCILSPAITGRVALGSSSGDLTWAAQFKPDRRVQERLVQMVPFFATYLPAETRRAVGDLDERFTDYGSDDDDYCYRARLAGIPVVVLPKLSCYHLPEVRTAHAERWGRDRFKPSGEINHGRLVEKHGQYPLPVIPYEVEPKTPAPQPSSLWLRREYEVFTVSGSPENYSRLLESIRRCQPELIGSGRLHCYAGWKPEEVDGSGVDFEFCPQLPGRFAVTRENNRALRDIWSRSHDAVMIEDDVELVAPGTLDQLALVAGAYGGRCIVQPAIEGFRYGNVVCTPSQNFRVRVEPKHYPLICVFFPLEVELLVGYYDENFTSFGCDDNDYSLRCVNAGVAQLALPWLAVRHNYGQSVYARRGAQDLGASREYFKRKWGRYP